MGLRPTNLMGLRPTNLMGLWPTNKDENARVSGAFDAPRKAGRGASRGPGGPPYFGWAFDRAAALSDGFFARHAPVSVARHARANATCG
jgi:hypothetical protein